MDCGLLFSFYLYQQFNYEFHSLYVQVNLLFQRFRQTLSLESLEYMQINFYLARKYLIKTVKILTFMIRRFVHFLRGVINANSKTRTFYQLQFRQINFHAFSQLSIMVCILKLNYDDTTILHHKNIFMITIIIRVFFLFLAMKTSPHFLYILYKVMYF